jgi:hypothetical protein
MTDLSNLISRLEAAQSGGAGLDHAVHEAAEPALFAPGWKWSTECPLPVTTSLDAALTLCERVLPGASCVGFDRTPQGSTAYVSRNNVADGHWLVEAEAPTPALALCLALLRALEAKADG